MLNRRALFGFMTAILAVATGSVAVADRYQNQSGLTPGRFVWSPSIAPEGALTIVVSPRERSVHAYRDGVEIGISTITTPAEADSPSGVFVVSQISGGRQGDASTGLIWRGTELYLGGASRVPESGIEARLPGDFAELLMEATHRGAAIIVARERSGPQLFSAPGPFIDPLETGSLNRVARFARPELRRQLTLPEPSRPQPPSADLPVKGSVPGEGGGVRGEITSLILSRADLSAYVMKDGLLVDRLPIAVEDPTKPLGLHAAVLVSPGDERHEAKWLAFGIDDDAGAEHVVSNKAEQAMRRVRFMDKGRSTTLARALKAGTMVVLMDGHGPSATEPPRFNVALLQSDEATSQSAVVQGAQSPPQGAGESAGASSKTQERAHAAPVSGSSASSKQARSGTKPQLGTARRGRGPLDQREAWPNSMYWPY